MMEQLDLFAPVLVDLCSCAGGATRGYQRAGFYVAGVDVDPQPRYCGDEFHQADALEFLAGCIDRGNRLPDGRPIAAAHASFPCQPFSAMSNCRPGLAATYPDLVAAGRALLEQSGLPCIIENVPGSPVRPDVILCGAQFGRALYRHRWFESNVPLSAPPAAPLSGDVRVKDCGWPHLIPASKAGHWRPGTIMSVAGNVGGVAHAREIMEMDWTNRRELGEAIPPYYTEHLGGQLLAAITEEQAAA
jgi:DNA (cytosine-5)-methyltransferase 1